MKNEVIATENGIASAQDLVNLPTNRLVGIFNSLPGVTQVKKFTNRTVGIKRLAAAFGLELPVETINLAVAKEGAAPKASKKRASSKKSKPAKKAKKAAGTRAKAVGTHKDAKKAEVIRLLGLTNGASLEKIMETTGWQAHTVRGFISILGKTMKIESFKTDSGVRTYRTK